MALNKSLQKFLDQGKQSDSYWVEHAKLGFSMALERQRKKAGLSYKDIAKKIATSAAYITKVFRGDTNLTIESMVKLARASGGKLEINIVSQDASTRNWGEKLKVIEGGKSINTTGASMLNKPVHTYRTGDANTQQQAA